VQTIKVKYEQGIAFVTDASESIGRLFKDKMVKIKTRLSEQFAGFDMRIN
jgi:hypothetical protein